MIKASIEAAALLKSLKRMLRTVPTRTTIPVLGCVRIVAKDDALNLTVTDLDISISDSVPCALQSDGEVCVDAHTLTDIAARAPAGATVVIEETDNHRLIVRTGLSRFQLPVLPAEDFPDLDAGQPSHEFTIPVADLLRIVARCGFAVSQEQTRHYLCGVYLHMPDRKLTLRAVATDGHRLAQLDMLLPQGAEGMPGIIVPSKTMSLWPALFEGSSHAHVSLSQSKMSISAGDLVLVSKLVDGTFPDYAHVIPTGNPNLAKFDIAAFIEAIDRVSLISSERGRAVKLNFEAGELSLGVSNPDGGDATDKLEIEYEGDEAVIGLNARYALDTLKAMSGDCATVALADPGSPVLFESDDEKSLFVIMPMRV